MKFKKKDYYGIYVFLGLFSLLFLIEIILFCNLTNDITYSLTYTLGFFFGIENPLALYSIYKNQGIIYFIIVIGYLLIIFNWIGLPILIIQYFLKKKSKEEEYSDRLKEMLIKSEIEKKGGFKKLKNAEELLIIMKSVDKKVSELIDKINLIKKKNKRKISNILGLNKNS